MEKKISGKHGNRVAVMKERMAAVVVASALLLGGGLTAKAQNTAVTTCSQSAATAIQQNPNWKANAAEWQKLKGEITLYMTNDMGRNGYYDQKPIAELMGEMADVVGPECVIAAGDIHHFNGVASTQDPLWLTNYEWVYSHPELMLDWFAVCGNHEYRGNTQAFMDYGKVSRRWMMPAKYYTKVFDHKGTTVRVIFLDTTPLIEPGELSLCILLAGIRIDFRILAVRIDEGRGVEEDDAHGGSLVIEHLGVIFGRHHPAAAYLAVWMLTA